MINFIINFWKDFYGIFVWYFLVEIIVICYFDEKYNVEKIVWNVKMFILINKSYILLCMFVLYVEKGKYVLIENCGYI